MATSRYKQTSRGVSIFPWPLLLCVVQSIYQLFFFLSISVNRKMLVFIDKLSIKHSSYEFLFSCLREFVYDIGYHFLEKDIRYPLWGP